MLVSMNIDAVRLRDAVLCLDCECITPSVRDYCLVCAGRSLIALSRLLGGVIEGPTARLLTMDSASLESVRELVESAAELPRADFPSSPAA